MKLLPMQAALAIWLFPFCVAAINGVRDDPAPTGPTRLYHTDPQHVWNRLNRTLFVRRDATGAEFGHDQLDVLLWPDTSRHLLAGPSREQARNVLREFVQRDGSWEASGPFASAVARATLQRDLWTAFDWAADLNAPFAPPDTEPARRELRGLLGRAIRHVALSRDAIGQLPDTYRAAVEAKTYPTEFDPDHPQTPFLPADLLDAGGPWVCVGEKSETQEGLHAQLVPQHVADLSRSVFMVFLRVPEGRPAALDYLKRLSEFPQPWVLNGGRPDLNPALPQFPAGTQVVLMRSAMLVDDRCQLAATRLVESIQIRTYTPTIAPPGTNPRDARRAGHSVHEFVLSPIRLLAGEQVALRPVAPDERGFDQFKNLSDEFESRARQGGGAIERRLIHESCFGCHSAPGVHGFNTYTRLFGPRLIATPRLTATTPHEPEQSAIFWKQTRADWGLLRGACE